MAIYGPYVYSQGNIASLVAGKYYLNLENPDATLVVVDGVSVVCNCFAGYDDPMPAGITEFTVPNGRFMVFFDTAEELLQYIADHSLPFGSWCDMFMRQSAAVAAIAKKAQVEM